MPSFFAGVIIILTLAYSLYVSVSQQRPKLRVHSYIIGFCFLTFCFIFLLGTWSISTELFTDKKLLASCNVSAMPEDCLRLSITSQLENWLHVLLYPVSHDICFTGHDAVCSYRQANLSIQSTLVRSVLYIGFVLFTAIPSLILYGVLWYRNVRRQPLKSKDSTIS